MNGGRKTVKLVLFFIILVSELAVYSFLVVFSLLSIRKSNYKIGSKGYVESPILSLLSNESTDDYKPISSGLEGSISYVVGQFLREEEMFFSDDWVCVGKCQCERERENGEVYLENLGIVTDARNYDSYSEAFVSGEVIVDELCEDYYSHKCNLYKIVSVFQDCGKIARMKLEPPTLEEKMTLYCDGHCVPVFYEREELRVISVNFGCYDYQISNHEIEVDLKDTIEEMSKPEFVDRFGTENLEKQIMWKGIEVAEEKFKNEVLRQYCWDSCHYDYKYKNRVTRRHYEYRVRVCMEGYITGANPSVNCRYQELG